MKLKMKGYIANTVEYILYVNNQNQQGQGLKILTPDQMLIRLPLSLIKGRK